MSDSSTTVTLPIQIDTGTDQLLARQEGRVGVVTLNRPEARNALSDQLTPALRQMIKRFGEDDSVGCLLLTGAGTAFCAGGDVKGMGGNRKKKDPPPSQEEAAEDLRLRQETSAALLLGGLTARSYNCGDRLHRILTTVWRRSINGRKSGVASFNRILASLLSHKIMRGFITSSYFLRLWTLS